MKPFFVEVKNSYRQIKGKLGHLAQIHVYRFCRERYFKHWVVVVFFGGGGEGWGKIPFAPEIMPSSLLKLDLHLTSPMHSRKNVRGASDGIIFPKSACMKAEGTRSLCTINQRCD